MLNEKSVQNYENFGELDLSDLLGIFWRDKVSVFVILIVLTISSIGYAFWVPEIYRAEAVLAPIMEEQSSYPIGGQLGLAASSIGLNISEAQNSINTYLAILQSRGFVSDFIDRHKLKVPLFATNWDRRGNEGKVDENLFDESTGEWLDGEPTDWQTYKLFRNILYVEQNRSDQLVTIAIEWQDPVLAANIVNWLVLDLDAYVRQKDLDESKSAIQYLQKQLQATQLLEMQKVFYQLIETQTRIVMLVDVRKGYAFETIDLAVVPEEKIKPNRKRIVIIGAITGLILGLLLAISKFYFHSSRGIVE